MPNKILGGRKKCICVCMCEREKESAWLRVGESESERVSEKKAEKRDNDIEQEHVLFRLFLFALSSQLVGFVRRKYIIDMLVQYTQSKKKKITLNRMECIFALFIAIYSIVFRSWREYYLF